MSKFVTFDVVKTQTTYKVCGGGKGEEVNGRRKLLGSEDFIVFKRGWKTYR